MPALAAPCWEEGTPPGREGDPPQEMGHLSPGHLQREPQAYCCKHRFFLNSALDVLLCACG